MPVSRTVAAKATPSRCLVLETGQSVYFLTRFQRRTATRGGFRRFGPGNECARTQSHPGLPPCSGTGFACARPDGRQYRHAAEREALPTLPPPASREGSSPPLLPATSPFPPASACPGPATTHNRYSSNCSVFRALGILEKQMGHYSGIHEP